MNNMNTPKPIEQSIGARYEIDSFLSDICLCIANRPPYRPEIKSYVERWFEGVAQIVVEVEKPSAAD